MSGENGIQLPNDYTASLLSFQKYPRFVVASSAYGPALLGIRERLILQQHRLFSKNVDKIVIPVREVNMTTDGRFQVTKRNLLTEAKVKEWIGDTSEQDPGDPAKSRGFLATKQDPLCRFMYIPAAKPSRTTVWDCFADIPFIDSSSAIALWRRSSSRAMPFSES